MPRSSSRPRFRKLRKDRHLQLATLVPALAAAVAAAQTYLPELREVAGPWAYFAASVVVSTLAAVFHARAQAPAPVQDEVGKDASQSPCEASSISKDTAQGGN